MLLEDNFELHYPGRCKDCLMREELCICSLIHEFDNKVKVTLVMHKRETRKTTNTGRLACKLLKNSRILVRGAQDRPLQLENHIKDPSKCLLLAVSPFAKSLTPEIVSNLNETELIVPDGSWSHASRMVQREKLFKEMQWVQLPPGPKSRYYLRKEPHPEGLATLEAIARALGILEGQQLQSHLETVFDVMVERTLKTRPKNREDQNRKVR